MIDTLRMGGMESGKFHNYQIQDVAEAVVWYPFPGTLVFR